MDSQKQRRQVQRNRVTSKNADRANSGERQICLPLSKQEYIATTAANGCILGVALTDQASDKCLTEAYGVFQKEATALDPTYEPETVNTDGWVSTQNAFKALFPSIVTILCFLHGFLKVRDRGRGEYELHQRIWEIYHSTNIQMFDRRMKAFRKWFEPQQWSTPIREMTAKLWNRARRTIAH